MLKLGRVAKVKVLFLALVFVFNFDLFKFSVAILEKGLLKTGLLTCNSVITLFHCFITLLAILSDTLPIDIESVSIHCETLEDTAVSLFFWPFILLLRSFTFTL